MDTELIKDIMPYVGGFGAVILALAILFKDSIRVFLEKDSTCKVTLKAHERALESHNERLNQVEKNVAVLPAIQTELGHIRNTLDTILAHLLDK